VWAVSATGPASGAVALATSAGAVTVGAAATALSVLPAPSTVLAGAAGAGSDGRKPRSPAIASGRLWLGRSAAALDLDWLEASARGAVVWSV
jgi:hypothetical protein